MSALALPIVVLALVLLTAWVTSVALFPAWSWLARRYPPLARWALVTGLVPTLTAVAVAVAALRPADPHLHHLTGCHCDSSMASWMHLCPVHPEAAAPLLLPALLVLAALLPGRIRALARLAREPLGLGGGGAPTLSDLPVPTALVVGWLRPSLVVDRRLWSALGPQEREVVLAHERAHLSRRDPTVVFALRLLVSFGPAPLGASLVRAWLDRAETRADASAARETGDPLLVAEALVRCARLGAAHTGLAPGWSGGSVEARVRAVLDLSADAEATARPDGGLVDLVSVIAMVIAGLALTPWLHHQLEHLLNLSL